ncbi:MAG TPA: tetratricopeptide repeat protein, partial [Candidatus Acidoferrales bacterium]|nr:tetratricopeptide repeat protein [Candidatus Acidoferrales bacterium]
MESFPPLRRDPIRAALIGLALLYALLAGLKTVADFDLGWQLATGRYIVQHHSIPSADVLSYTARGSEWIYPPFSGVILYIVAALGGWTALSWLNALACIAVVALLVLPGGRLTALFAILAVPAIDYRTEPRSELFTTVLFAASFGLLWRHYRGERARLWLLPVLMLLWVNLHTGFAAGLALVAGYVLLEFLELPFAAQRSAALVRVRQAAPWCALTALATLVNPWGYRIYDALIRQNQAGQLHNAFIGEWSSVRLNSAALAQFLSPRDPASGDWWLLLIAAAAAAATIWRKRLGPALLLAGGAYLACAHIRFQALFAILVVTIAGALPSRIAAAQESQPSKGPFAPWRRAYQRIAARSDLLPAVVVVAALLVGIRSFDLVTNRHYIIQGQVSLFGPGPSWWYPERAAEFLRREKLPGNVFNDFDLGGYLAWRIGPEYPGYVDSRYIPFGADFLLHKNHLMASPPDSPDWTAEANARNINLAIFSLSRYGQLEHAPLLAFCSSQSWKPVYLDEVSVIFLRVRPENEPWLKRLALDCRTAPIVPPMSSPDSSAGRADNFEFYANAGSVFYVLSRDAEAAAALDRAGQLFPGDPNLHLIRGELLEATGQTGEAEQEYRTSLEIAPTDAAWYALGRLYGAERRYPQAADAVEHSAELSLRDYDRYRVLGQIQLAMNQPQLALATFDRAERRSPFEKGAAALGIEFHAHLAEDRARAWRALGDLTRATAYAEQSVQLTPENAARRLFLSDLHAAQGSPA